MIHVQDETLTKYPREFEFFMASMVQQIAVHCRVPVRMLQMEPIHNSHVVDWIRVKVLKV